MINLTLFASGNGSNAENIFQYFKNIPDIQIVALFSNNPDAYALKRAENNQITAFQFTKDEFYNSENVLHKLKNLQTDYIILAGFLWLIPESFTHAYPNRIINIHPALLPKFGGKGMYGMHVHRAVVDQNETQTGITIHLVNEKYDDGKILFQDYCKVEKMDTPETVAEKVHALEYRWFPEIIHQYIEKQKLI